MFYDQNDSGQCYKTTIMIVSYALNLALALASVVNYNCKWHHNLKRHLLDGKLLLEQRAQVLCFVIVYFHDGEEPYSGLST